MVEFRHRRRFHTASARGFHNSSYDILGKTCEKESRKGLKGGGNVRQAGLAQQEAGIDVANVIGVCEEMVEGGGTLLCHFPHVLCQRWLPKQMGPSTLPGRPRCERVRIIS